MRSTLAKRTFHTAFARVHDVVARIPRGKVMTYGGVAQLAGMPRGARVVGYALRASDRPLPWQRVMGQRRPGIAQVTIKDPIGAAMQRQLLEREGVRFTETDGVDLGRYGMLPCTTGKAKKKGTMASRSR